MSYSKSRCSPCCIRCSSNRNAGTDRAPRRWALCNWCSRLSQNCSHRRLGTSAVPTKAVHSRFGASPMLHVRKPAHSGCCTSIRLCIQRGIHWPSCRSCRSCRVCSTSRLGSCRILDPACSLSCTWTGNSLHRVTSCCHRSRRRYCRCEHWWNWNRHPIAPSIPKGSNWRCSRRKYQIVRRLIERAI